MHLFSKKTTRLCLIVLFIAFSPFLRAQYGSTMKWSRDGNAYYELRENEILRVSLPSGNTTVIISKDKLIPPGRTKPLFVRNFSFSADEQEILIYTNTRKVWRYDTRGDYWLYKPGNGSLVQLGKSLPPSSLMFAKFSPDGNRVAYVSEHNLYVEDLSSNQVRQLTSDGTHKLINGTFDWVYEEELNCRDGFRWSPDGKKIAYWQIDARATKDYLMIDNTDSIYPVAKPVEYPIAGEPPSPYKIAVVDIANKHTTWMKIPTDPVLRSYVPRMEWAAGSNELIIQHLNRKQNESRLMLCNVNTGDAHTIYTEKDAAWIDIISNWDNDYWDGGWDWLNNGAAFLWASEKDGWRHLFAVSRDGKKETLVTPGNYDVMDISRIDEKGGYVYFIASPSNATQAYLYRSRLDGKGQAELLSPSNQPGTHAYEISPTAKYALHTFSNYYTPNAGEWVSLPAHIALNGMQNISVTDEDKAKSNISFFKIRTGEGVEMDGWMVKPRPFDSTKKYPVVFYVYSEPGGQMVKDAFGACDNFLYQGDMAADGYIYISIDNRGTPAPKGSEWRKCIQHKIGTMNISDQALAAREILKWPYVDPDRIAVWGWSGGGTATLNLMFQHPDIYKTGIAVAAEGNSLTYDNIYQERYMGLPQENRDDYIKGSPITYAKNLKGNLLYIHGTGDDNVHYNNAEMLINELVKYNKQFQLMSYPNRTHSISEGHGTTQHLATLYTRYLREYCPPGGK